MQVEIAPRIVVDPEVRHGKPVVKGTRVPISLVLAELAGGQTAEEIMEAYAISKEDIQAVLRYAADLVADEEIRLRV
ncbi:MAG TPA: DUF433 domain-containing protein [Chloroflexota bacterium]